MRYSISFERDFKWYLSVRSIFNFDGNNLYTDKKGDSIIIYNKNGISGKEAFFKWDSNGKIIPTKHPNIFNCLLKVKGSCNLHIKMYAEDRAKGFLPKDIFDKMCSEFNAPKWFIDAVESQKFKYYDPC